MQVYIYQSIWSDKLSKYNILPIYVEVFEMRLNYFGMYYREFNVEAQMNGCGKEYEYGNEEGIDVIECHFIYATHRIPWKILFNHA